jgi:hypothetical protein
MLLDVCLRDFASLSQIGNEAWRKKRFEVVFGVAAAADAAVVMRLLRVLLCCYMDSLLPELQLKSIGIPCRPNISNVKLLYAFFVIAYCVGSHDLSADTLASDCLSKQARKSIFQSEFSQIRYRYERQRLPQ